MSRRLHILGLVALLFSTGTTSCAAAICDVGPAAAAQSNARSLSTMAWSPFGRTEAGWEVYEPLIAQELGTGCPAASPGFALALGQWEKKHGLPATGVIDGPTFNALKQVWQARRPFVAAAKVVCPAAPQDSALAQASASESYGGKQIQLQPPALAAYRKLVAAARKDVPALATNPLLLTIFSGYRSPSYDAARCLSEQNCQGITRAACSAHRTGLAMDLYLGAAPGFMPDSSDDANRLYLSRSPAYLWLVHNAARFGFANYPFEPWHWEWTGATENKSSGQTAGKGG